MSTENQGRRLITSEAVTEGHPDKVCDQIADAVLDAILTKDPEGRVACEVVTTKGIVCIMGEITTDTMLDFGEIAHNTMEKIGYTDGASGIDAQHAAVISSVHSQSPDIAQGVNEGEDHELGAGDQGIIFGYATNETREYMPMPIVLAQKLCMRLAEVRKKAIVPHLRPDGKSQVSVEYENGKPKRVASILISAQHDGEAVQKELKEAIWKEVVLPTIDSELLDADTEFLFNPTGRFEVGGPRGDSGLTGRKLIVDSYGSAAHHGGGALSGKDPTKVDRSSAYYARYVAKNLVAAGLCDKCEICVAYAIGRPEPFSIDVDSYGTGKISDEELLQVIRDNFDFRPSHIIKSLDLRRPIYSQVACYGHFGRDDLDLPWEKTDKAEELKKYLK